MYIIAIAWIYVVFMMSITEVSIVAGVMTFLLYGLLPVGIIVYVMGSGRRKRKRRAQERQQLEELQAKNRSAESASSNTDDEEK